MIKITNTEVTGWAAAIRGMRNPMNSWDKSDTDINWLYDDVYIGNNDLKLMKKLAKAGSDEAKYKRFIVVTCDITAPLYWWKEFDTYKVGTVANSTSTMHRIHAKEFDLTDFSYHHISLNTYVDVGGAWSVPPMSTFKQTMSQLNAMRELYLQTKDKFYWWNMIQLLPSSYNQLRTIQFNYQVLTNMYHARKNHKLDEWRDLCKWIESLPYSELITGGGVE